MLTSDSISERDGDEIIALPIGDERSEVFLAQTAGVIVAMRRDAAYSAKRMIVRSKTSLSEISERKA